MIKVLLLLSLALNIYASKILSYNIYDRTDRVDVMITFDTPYDGVIKQSKAESKIVIKLEDTSIESSKLKKLSSKYIRTLSITPMAGYTQIVASVPGSVALQASKTADGYGLRLRFANPVAKKEQNNNYTQNVDNTAMNLPTKPSTDMSQSYYIVVAILVLGIITLLVLKNKIANPNKNQKNSSWLYKDTVSKQNSKELSPASTNNTNTNDVSIRFQKSLNENNSVVMLDFGEQSYLVLMGNSNILLDKFTGDKPLTNDEFENILQSRHEELENFISGESDRKYEEYEPLQAYKYKASSISYEA